MTKLTETEGLILAELLLKLARGDEKLADEIVDTIYDMVEASRGLSKEKREQENIYRYIAGWGV